MQGDIRTQTGDTRADAADEDKLKLKSEGSMVARSRRNHSTLSHVLASAAVPDKKSLEANEGKKEEEEEKRVMKRRIEGKLHASCSRLPICTGRR